MTILPANALCNRKQVKDSLKIVQADSLLDNMIHEWIGRISTAFENYCGRKFIAQAYTEYHDGGVRSIFPHQNPINSITSIHGDSSWVWGSDTLLDSSNYRIVYGKYIIYDGVFAYGQQSIKLVYNAGYTTIPADLTQACGEEVGRKQKHIKSYDEVSKTMGDGTVNYAELNFLPQTIQTLNQYRLNWAL